MPNWIQFQKNLEGITNAFTQQQKQKQEMQQALQIYLLKAQIEQQIKQQDPAYQMNQLQLAQALQEMQRQQQFQRKGDIAYGGQRPTAQEVLPMVPQQFQQKFMQRPTSPPGLAGQYRQQLRQPYKQAGQTLIPTGKGWQQTRLPTQTTDKTTQRKIQLQSLAQQEAYRQMGGSMMVGLSETKRKEYEELTNSLYKSYLKQFNLSETNTINIGGEEGMPDEETNIMDTNW
jgi:hypothetical protein